MESVVINIAKDFSKYPAGRYRADGEFSGEVFRDDHLLPAIKNADEVCINLDGGMGYGSSFLEESFGGLVRKHHISPSLLHNKLKIISDEDPTLINEIWEYIDQAED